MYEYVCEERWLKLYIDSLQLPVTTSSSVVHVWIIFTNVVIMINLIKPNVAPLHIVRDAWSLFFLITCFGVNNSALVHVGYWCIVYSFCFKVSLVIDVSFRTYLGTGWYKQAKHKQVFMFSNKIFIFMPDWFCSYMYLRDGANNVWESPKIFWLTTMSCLSEYLR